jgi:phage tail-like protein
MARKDPLRNFRYRLEIDGIVQAGFSEVAIGDSTIEPIEYREGNNPLKTVQKLSGLTKYANLTLKWGLTDSKELADWHHQIIEDVDMIEGNLRRTVVIHILNEAGQDKSSYEIVNAWPTKYDPSDLNGKGNEVAIETLELVNEGMRRIQ